MPKILFSPFSSTFFNEMKWSTRPQLHPRLGPIPFFFLSSSFPLSLVFPGKDDVSPIYQIMVDSRINNIKYLTITLNYFKSLHPVHSLQLLKCL